MRLRRSLKGSPHSGGPTTKRPYKTHSHPRRFQKRKKKKRYLFQSPKILSCELRLICAHNGLHARWFIAPIQGFPFSLSRACFNFQANVNLIMVPFFRALFRNHFARETLLHTTPQVCTLFPYRNSIYCSLSQFKLKILEMDVFDDEILTIITNISLE